MITELIHAHEAFFSQFILAGDYTNPQLVFPHKGSNLTVPVRFYKKSAADRTEETVETYPVLSIQAMQPKVHKESYNAFDPERFVDPSDSSTITVAEHPIPIMFTYQVSFASKDFTQDTSYNTWFIKKFMSKNAEAFIYNPIVIPMNDNLDSEDIVGDYVSYSFEELDIIREDGIFETAHRFTVGPVWVAMQDTTTQDTVSTLNILLTRGDL